LSFVLSGNGVPERDLDLDNFTTDPDIATNNDSITFTSEENSVFSVAIQNSVATIKAVNAKFTTDLGTLFDGILYERVTEKIKFTATDSFAESDSDELTYKQNMKFNSYLNKLGFKDFNSWWEQEGKEELSDVYTEAIINNEKITDDGSISDWWNKYLQNNLSQIIRQLKFMQIWGDSLGRNL
jgi:hypothetical protein